MSRATRLLAITLSCWLVGCSAPGDQATSETEREIAAFQQKLSSGMSFADACNELDVLCKTTGFGCKAHKLFCQVPNKQQICQQLAAACPTYPAACDVYKLHCGGQLPADGGVLPPPPGCGDGQCDPNMESCQSCPTDCGKCPGTQCGDNTCDKAIGEDCQSCPQDCGKCWPNQCGDGQCDPNMETCQSCPTDCGKCTPSSPNSGQPCSQNQPCPQGDTCLMIDPSQSSGMCLASCQSPGAQCPSATPGTYSVCGLQNAAANAYYCVYVCEAQGQTVPCPKGLTCQAVSSQVGTKICMP